MASQGHADAPMLLGWGSGRQQIIRRASAKSGRGKVVLARNGSRRRVTRRQGVMDTGRACSGPLNVTAWGRGHT